MSDTNCGRLISVLAFYVFSCSCFRDAQPRKPSREIRHEAQALWREEIESGPIPSFIKNNNHCRQASRGSSRVNSKNSRASTPSSAKATSRCSLPLKPGAEPEPLENLIPQAEKRKPQRITTVTVSELPKIHPPINDRHPPVVSALPESKSATAWMTLPPPPARVMRAINRATHLGKSSQRDGTDTVLWGKRLANLENRSTSLSSSKEKSEVTLVEDVEKSIWKRHYEDQDENSEAMHRTLSQEIGSKTRSGIPSPASGAHSRAEYGCRYLDPSSGATKSYTLTYDQEFLGQTPPPSATTFVEIVRRPPPALKAPLAKPESLNGFEDIYS
ncbi:uncharacterized protein LAJ45_02144 [Morchella importuna]|uniref:uncharacterized protein n=1 Tax=Morchella importuna TaxID=1174673 RepID=UPI001E8D4C6A|nr:uncharacterized protein LAJ45_02144 [Morchella importuna]KAH8154376.1 hypothetical protein LAJ45_02144 [Morchella importuna]